MFTPALSSPQQILHVAVAVVFGTEGDSVGDGTTVDDEVLKVIAA